MNLLASLSLAIIIAMSPAAMEAFGEICRMQVVDGVMTLKDGGEAQIEATGKRDRTIYRNDCLWKNGFPVYIRYVRGGKEL